MTDRAHVARLDIASDVETEVAAVLRRLARTPWLVAGRDNDEIAVVRRNADAIRTVLSRLGWSLAIDRGLVRLYKSPPPRIDDWVGQAPSPQACVWMFLFAAAAESLPRTILISQLIDAGKVVAAETLTPVHEGATLRRAHSDALSELIQRGLVEETDGHVSDYVDDPDAQVLLTIEHTRLPYLIANFNNEIDPVTDPEDWVAAVSREPDPARRMRRRLVDDTVVHTVDLDDQEADWLSRRLRAGDGGPLADAFGLAIERRTEGAAFVVPDEAYRRFRDLGDVPFPGRALLSRVALVLCDYVSGTGAASDQSRDAPGPGWRGMEREMVLAELADIASRQAAGRGGWAADVLANPAGLLQQAEDLLIATGLLRVVSGWWWISPATGRWEAPPNSAFATPPPVAAQPEHTNESTLFDQEDQ